MAQSLVCIVRPTGGGKDERDMQNLFGWKNDIIMDTRRKLLLIRYRFGELIID